MTVEEHAEERVLGAILAAGTIGASKSAMALTRAAELHPEDFWRRHYGALFGLFVEMDGRNVELTPVSVAAEIQGMTRARLEDLGQLVGGAIDTSHLVGTLERLAQHPGAFITQIQRLATIVVDGARYRHEAAA